MTHQHAEALAGLRLLRQQSRVLKVQRRCIIYPLIAIQRGTYTLLHCRWRSAWVQGVTKPLRSRTTRGQGYPFLAPCLGARSKDSDQGIDAARAKGHGLAATSGLRAWSGSYAPAGVRHVHHVRHSRVPGGRAGWWSGSGQVAGGYVAATWGEDRSGHCTLGGGLAGGQGALRQGRPGFAHGHDHGRSRRKTRQRVCRVAPQPAPQAADNCTTPHAPAHRSTGGVKKSQKITSAGTIWAPGWVGTSARHARDKIGGGGGEAAGGGGRRREEGLVPGRDRLGGARAPGTGPGRPGAAQQGTARPPKAARHGHTPRVGCIRIPRMIRWKAFSGVPAAEVTCLVRFVHCMGIMVKQQDACNGLSRGIVTVWRHNWQPGLLIGP